MEIAMGKLKNRKGFMMASSIFLITLLLCVMSNSKALAGSSSQYNLQTAINVAAKSNSIVNLQKNVTLTKDVVVNNTICLTSKSDVTINTGSYSIIVGKNGNLIVDGKLSITGSGDAVVQITGGKFTLRKGTINGVSRAQGVSRKESKIDSYLETMPVPSIDQDFLKNSLSNSLNDSFVEKSSSSAESLKDQIFASSTDSVGIVAENGEVNINGGTINAYIGIRGRNSNVTITNGSIIAQQSAVAVDYGNVTMKNGSINIDGGYGIIDIGGNVKITGGSITATETGAGALVLSGNLNFTGGRINLEGQTGIGFYTISGNLNISGGVINLDVLQGYGVAAVAGECKISGGDISVSGDKSIYCIGTQSEKLIITGGRITATANGQSVGIQSYNSEINLDGGNVEANGRAAIALFGVEQNDVHIDDNASLIGRGTDSSFGALLVDGKTAINNGRVSATGDNGIGLFAIQGESVAVNGGEISADGNDSIAMALTNSAAVINKGTISAESGIFLADSSEATVYPSKELSIQGGIYSGRFADGPINILSKKAFLTRIPNPISIAAHENAVISLEGVDEAISFSIDPASSTQLEAIMDGNNVTVSGETPGGYSLILTGEYGGNLVQIRIPVTVAQPSYTVTFNKNGGNIDAKPSTKTVQEGNKLGTLPKAPKRTGYLFNGWNTMPDGSGINYTKNTVITEDITLYAQWIRISQSR